jgi:hypothetical protein
MNPVLFFRLMLRAIGSPRSPASNFYLRLLATQEQLTRKEETGETPVLPCHPFLESVNIGAIGGPTS